MSTRSRKAAKLHQITKRVHQPAIVSSNSVVKRNTDSEFGLLTILLVLIVFYTLI